MQNHSMHEDIESILFSEDELKTRVAELGKEIEKDLLENIDFGERVIFVGVLRGAASFMQDLVRNIDLPIQLDYLYASSYGDEAKSSGEVTFDSGALQRLKGAHVVIVEDIIDTGLTMYRMKEEFLKCGAKSVRLAALIVKDVKREMEIIPDYFGMHCPNEFIVGYGLDYAQMYRNLPYIGILKRAVYES